MAAPSIIILVAGALVLLGSATAQAQDPLEELTRHRSVAESAAEIPPDSNSGIRWDTTPRTAPNKRYWKGIWIATWAAFVAVNVVDAHSSSGRREANPLLRDDDGVFSGRRALVVKSAAGGGFFALQAWLAHRNPNENHYKAFAIATGSATAALGVVAVRNYGVRKVAEPQAVAAPAYLLRE